MTSSMRLIREPIDEAALAAERPACAGSGAVVVFLGVVRDTEGGRKIAALEYEAFERMAEHQIQLIFGRLEQQWTLTSARLIHRLGIVKAGEASLWLEITAAHRQEALAACAYLIDELKLYVPIWKRPMESESCVTASNPEPARAPISEATG